MVILRAMANARVDAQFDQAAWTTLSQSLARAQDYDFQNLPSPACPVFHRQIPRDESTLCIHLDERAMCQAICTGQVGRLSLGNPATTADAT